MQTQKNTKDLPLSKSTTIAPRRSIPLWRRFQFNVTVLALAPIFVVVLAFIFIAVPTQIANARSAQSRQLEIVATLKVQLIQSWLERVDSSMDVLRNDDQFSVERLQSLIDAGGDSQLQSTQAVDLQNILSQSDLFEELFVYKADGTILTATAQELVSRNVSFQPYYSVSLKKDHNLYPPFYEVGSGLLAIYVSERIVTPNGNTIAVIAGRVKLDTLGQIVSNRDGLGTTAETYLVSLANSYLLTPSRLPEYSLFRSYHSQGIDQVLTQQNGSGEYSNYENPPRPVFGAYRWIPELQVGLLAEISQQEALASIFQTRDTSILVVAFVAFMIIGRSIFVARRISSPVNLLADAVEELRQGDLTKRVKESSKNEIGILETAFNGMAQDLQRSFAELEVRIKEANDAKHLAEEADQLKSTFLANMSHELRTPLNAVINFTKFVQRGVMGSVNPQQTETLTKVVWHAEHLLTLINDVLDMSKIEAGAMSLFLEDQVDLNEIFNTVSDTAGALLAEKPAVRFESTIAPDLPTIRADKQRVTQILLNVVSNACKFTKQGSIDLSAVVKQDVIQVSIADTGPGIAPEDHVTVFEPFRQTNAGLRQGTGTGLGMPISKKLVEAHGGQLWFESIVGKGTTFYITFPIDANSTNSTNSTVPSYSTVPLKVAELAPN